MTKDFKTALNSTKYQQAAPSTYNTDSSSPKLQISSTSKKKEKSIFLFARCHFRGDMDRSLGSKQLTKAAINTFRGKIKKTNKQDPKT